MNQTNVNRVLEAVRNLPNNMPLRPEDLTTDDKWHIVDYTGLDPHQVDKVLSTIETFFDK